MLSHSTLDKPIFFLFFEKMYKIFGQSKKKQYLCALFRLLGSKVALLRGRMIPFRYANVEDSASRLTDVNH